MAINPLLAAFSRLQCCSLRQEVVEPLQKNAKRLKMTIFFIAGEFSQRLSCNHCKSAFSVALSAPQSNLLHAPILPKMQRLLFQKKKTNPAVKMAVVSHCKSPEHPLPGSLQIILDTQQPWASVVFRKGLGETNCD